jgi:single-strand DNA-binding protein
MAGSLNKVTLIGNVGADPDARSFSDGNKVINFSIATSESWKDKNTGERREKTEWHRVVIFNDGLVTICEKYLRKGSKVYIEGQIETRKWTDQSGVEKYTTEIVLRPFRGELTMLDSRNSDGGGFGDSSQPMSAGGGNQGQGSSQQQAPVMDDFEDEIPF